MKNTMKRLAIKATAVTALSIAAVATVGTTGAQAATPSAKPLVISVQGVTPEFKAAFDKCVAKQAKVKKNAIALKKPATRKAAIQKIGAKCFSLTARSISPTVGTNTVPSSELTATASTVGSTSTVGGTSTTGATVSTVGSTSATGTTGFVATVGGTVTSPSTVVPVAPATANTEFTFVRDESDRGLPAWDPSLPAYNCYNQ